ncbi:ankyrin repeat-containing domain protein, partial [Baffinella frigidus]
DQGGQTLLMSACEHDLVDVALILLERGADLSARDKSGMTPLHYAARGGAVNILSILIAKKANVMAASNDG